MLDALQPFSTFISPVKSLNRTKPSKNPYHSWFRILWRKNEKTFITSRVWFTSKANPASQCGKLKNSLSPEKTSRKSTLHRLLFTGDFTKFLLTDKNESEFSKFPHRVQLLALVKLCINYLEIFFS